MGDHVVAVEPGGDELRLGGFGEEVAGELIADELVVREVVVKGFYHPVAPDPHVPAAVDRIAVSIGVAGEVEPVDGHAFAEARGGEEGVDEAFVGVGPAVGEEVVHGLRRGEQAGEVQREAADERAPVGFGRGFEAFAFERGEDKVIDRIRGPAGFVDLGGGGAGGRDKRPVRFVDGALGDPGADGFDLEGREFVVGVDRRHPLFGVGGGEAVHDLAAGRVAGDDGRGGAVAGGVSAFGGVEPQFRFPARGVGPVAGVAVLRKDGADVVVEIDLAQCGCLVRGGGRRGGSAAEEDAGGQDKEDRAKDRHGVLWGEAVSWKERNAGRIDNAFQAKSREKARPTRRYLTKACKHNFLSVT